MDAVTVLPNPGVTGGPMKGLFSGLGARTRRRRCGSYRSHATTSRKKITGKLLGEGSMFPADPQLGENQEQRY